MLWVFKFDCGPAMVDDRRREEEEGMSREEVGALFLGIEVRLHPPAGRSRIFGLSSLVHHSIVIQELRTSRQET